MGLFDRKNCDICGNKIGLLGNRKLEDGNLCKDCAAKLSPHFSERRHATVQEIREQLQYREANKLQVASFRTTRSWGETYNMLRIDDNTGRFALTNSRDLEKENPDIIPLSAVTDAVLDINEYRTEITHRGPDGSMVPDKPPRYSYHYDFYVRIRVEHPYFDELSVKLNPSTLDVDEPARPGSGRNGAGRPSVSRDVLGSVLNALTDAVPFNPHEDPEYVRFAAMGDEVVEALKTRPQAQRVPLQNAMQQAAATIAAAARAAKQAEQPAPQPAPALNFCPQCGQKLENPSRFCPSCGAKLTD